MLVSVPLRKQRVEGLVLDVFPQNVLQEGAAFKVLKVQKILSKTPLLSRYQLQTLSWISKQYLCSLRQALRVFLPFSPWSTLLPPTTTIVSLEDGGYVAKGDRQRRIIACLHTRGTMSPSSLLDETGASLASVRSLLEKNVLSVRDHIDEQKKYTNYVFAAPPPLTPEQVACLRDIRSARAPTLLFGITGSGKTEIYAHLIAEAAACGKQSILLLPEILLTEHHLARFTKLLPGHIEVVHSRLTAAQRRAAFRRIAQGDIALVIGSRSALFSPLRHLTLILIDEEHEWTYKNEQTPRYHAREVAEALAAYSGAKLVLGTATPSLESYARAKAGVYHMARLQNRYGGAQLPVVRVVDLAPVQFGKLYPFSPTLLSAIQERLRRQEQCILFLNRRGIAASLLCTECRRRILSEETGLPFTVHRASDGRPFLLDHVNGAVLPVPASCPSCHATSLRAVGIGTQKTEDLLQSVFPTARVLRADRDVLRHPGDIQRLLARMRDRKADILLGTQSVVKGLDLPGVTLAAVLLADIGLSLPSFRAGERVFQLLTQLTGRSGRVQPGEVIIQTFRPEAEEVLFAAKHETQAYLERELTRRKTYHYPPWTRMIRLVFSGLSAQANASEMLNRLQLANATLLSPALLSLAPTLYGGGKVWHILVRSKDPRSLFKGIDLRGCSVDVDPIDCL